MRTIKEIPRLKPRPKESHKGNFDKICIIADNRDFSDVAAIAAKNASCVGGSPKRNCQA